MYNQQEHLSAITSFLADVNARKDNPYILKGGTALSLCYALNRFSEDIDLDVALVEYLAGLPIQIKQSYSAATVGTRRDSPRHGNVGRSKFRVCKRVDISDVVPLVAAYTSAKERHSTTKQQASCFTGVTYTCRR